MGYRIVSQKTNLSMSWRIRKCGLKLREFGQKTLDEAVTRALQIKAMYEAESRRSKGRSVRVV